MCLLIFFFLLLLLETGLRRGGYLENRRRIQLRIFRRKHPPSDLPLPFMIRQGHLPNPYSLLYKTLSNYYEYNLKLYPSSNCSYDLI